MTFLSLMIGLLLLVFSGDGLVKGSVQLSRHLKISTLVVGLTVVAFGTSAPELFVSVKAAYRGVPDLAIGNVVGSNIINIGLVLGLVAVFMPIAINNRSIVKDWVVMMVASATLVFVVQKGAINFVDGLLFLLFLVIYVVWSVYSSKKSEKKSNTFIAPEFSVIKSVIYIIVSVGGLYLGAEMLVDSATKYAVVWGMSDRLIGISLVALGTSIPELVTSLVAAFRKEGDISVGNIIGSNIFNIWAVLGSTALFSNLPVNEWNNVLFDIVISLIFGLLLLLLILPLRNGVITRWKGAVLFVLYMGYLLYVFKV